MSQLYINLYELTPILARLGFSGLELSTKNVIEP